MSLDNSKNRLAVYIAAALAIVIVGAALTLVILGINKPVSNADQGSFAPLNVSGPANLASGGVVFGNSMRVEETPGVSAGETPIFEEVNRAAGEVDVVVYVDYRCPHCMMFEQVNGPLLVEAANTHGVSVEVRPLTFMDRYSAGSAYSSRAANAFACTASLQPEFAWGVHSALLTPQVQPSGEGPGPTNEQLIDLLDSVTGGASDALKSCVIDETFVDFVGAVNDWTFEHPVAFSENDLMVQGTPLVVVSGKEFSGDIGSTDELRSFLIAQGVALD